MDWLLDVFATWLYGLKVIAITLAVIMFISGLDDFFIDVVYWVRRIKRKLSVYRRYPRMSYRELYKPDEKPLAIMVPAWNETGVIGNMAELAATTLDYENYHIFVGTYPNDPDTQRDVDEVCARFPNVHKVICARPGPTSKADCLNNVLDAITQFERSANFAFAGFILHDAEDVISPMELRLFNYLVERKDLIQIPVYPFEREWTHFTSMTYIDEFSELHGKDVPVREALAGQVPSAGVGTEEQLDTALRNRVEGLRLGGSMLMQGLISAEQLAQALAEQNGVAWESIDAWQIPSSLIAEMPASVALHYAVLPLRLDNDELIVGSEDGIDPVSLAALTRKVGRKVRYVIVLRGQIVTGLRHWYARRRGHDPRAMLYNAVQHQWLTEQQAGEIWRQYVPHQFLFAEILTTLGHINRSAINVLLLRHERSSLPLGKFLVTEGVISQETLDRVLTIQRELQVSMQSLLLKAGLNTEQVAQLESENEGE